MFLIRYNTQYYFMKVFLKASIVCIFYEHFVILVCTLTRFIRGNEIKRKTFYVSCFFCHIGQAWGKSLFKSSVFT